MKKSGVSNDWTGCFSIGCTDNDLRQDAFQRFRLFLTGFVSLEDSGYVRPEDALVRVELAQLPVQPGYELIHGGGLLRLRSAASQELPGGRLFLGRNTTDWHTTFFTVEFPH